MKFVLKFDWLCEMTHVKPAELFFLRPEGKWSICFLICVNVQVSVFPDSHIRISVDIWTASVKESLWILDSDSSGIQFFMDLKQFTKANKKPPIINKSLPHVFSSILD